jgi:CMP-2-keto-3-deoxyoctulosonic acid synthetase
LATANLAASSRLARDLLEVINGRLLAAVVGETIGQQQVARSILATEDEADVACA